MNTHGKAVSVPKTAWIWWGLFVVEYVALLVVWGLVVDLNVVLIRHLAQYSWLATGMVTLITVFIVCSVAIIGICQWECMLSVYPKLDNEEKYKYIRESVLDTFIIMIYTNPFVLPLIVVWLMWKWAYNKEIEKTVKGVLRNNTNMAA